MLRHAVRCGALAIFGMLIAGCIFDLNRDRPTPLADVGAIIDGTGDSLRGDARVPSDIYADAPLPIPTTTMLETVATTIVLP